MTSWQPTPALVRAVVMAAFGLAGGLLTGRAGLVVLAAPFLVLALVGVAARPRSDPTVRARLDHLTLHEGQATTSRLDVDDLSGVEHVTRVTSRAPYVATVPVSGVAGQVAATGLPEVVHGPRRWGRRALGAERVGLTGAWGAWRWGPVNLPGDSVFVLPQVAPYDARAQAPQPDGLVGAHRGPRIGSGTDFDGIRPFATGDRLRRISWPVSLRTGQLHVVTTRSEQDAGVWLVLDALQDVGRSGGIDGPASSLDRGVRAVAALADHHVRRGDRVGLVVVGAEQALVPLGSGTRHLHRVMGRLARTRPLNRPLHDNRLSLRIAAGSVVYVVSPMLAAPIASATGALLRQGQAVVVVDPVAELSSAAEGSAREDVVRSLAARMRAIQREDRLDHLAALGCPVVTWRGPGTLDEVLTRLARRQRVPRVRQS
jgi:uncharacterized protein (DUF58 family)